MTDNLWGYQPAAGHTVGTDLIGYKVEATDGSIGKVDKHSDDVTSSYLVVDTGVWIFGKHVLLPAGTVSRVDNDEKKVFVDGGDHPPARLPPPPHAMGRDVPRSWARWRMVGVRPRTGPHGRGPRNTARRVLADRAHPSAPAAHSGRSRAGHGVTAQNGGPRPHALRRLSFVRASRRRKSVIPSVEFGLPPWSRSMNRQRNHPSQRRRDN